MTNDRYVYEADPEEWSLKTVDELLVEASGDSLGFIEIAGGDDQYPDWLIVVVTDGGLALRMKQACAAYLEELRGPL